MNFKPHSDAIYGGVADKSRRSGGVDDAPRCSGWLRRAISVPAIGLACIALAACDSEGGRVRSPATDVNVIHVAGSFGNLEFRRVERLEGTLGYRSSSVFSWDSDTYTFNIDATIPGLSTPLRLYTFTADLAAGNDYSIVLTEADGWLQELVVGEPVSELAEGEAEIIIVNTANGLEGAVDVYLEPPETVLAAATPRGAVGFLESLPLAQIEPGEYELSLTQVGNPTSVVMASNPFQIAAGARTTLTLIDGLSAASPVAALVSGAGIDIPLTDRELRAGIRVLNAMNSREPLDVTVDNSFSPPLIPGAQFAEPTAFALLPPGEYMLQVTPGGNSGVIEVETTYNAFPGQRGTWFVRGAPGALSAAYWPDGQRLIRDIAEVTIYHGGTTINEVDVYIVAPDTDLGTVAPTASLSQTTVISHQFLGLGPHTITVRESGTETVLAGPVDANIGVEGNYGILLTDGASGSGADITLFDGFDPQ